MAGGGISREYSVKEWWKVAAVASWAVRSGSDGVGMGLASDELVEIQLGKNAGEPSVVTVNCPDKTGLGCDLCRIILEFGLCITRGGERVFYSDSS